MKIRTTQLLATGAVFALTAGTASAATISFSSAAYTGPGDVATNDATILAVNAGQADLSDVTENGVIFTGNASGTATANGVTAQFFSNPGTSTSSDDLPGNPDLFDTHAWTQSGADGSINFSGLSENTAYTLQLFIGDTRSCCSGRFVHIWDEGGPAAPAGAADLTLTATGDNNVVTGTFTTGAGETTQSLFISIDDDNDPTNGTGFGGFDGHVNAFQLRAIPEPGSLALLGLGGLMIARRRRG